MRFVRITGSGYWQGEMATGNNNGVMPLKRRLMPFLAWTPLVNANSLQADFWAALTGALVVLPQGIAYATIAGMPPVYGLYAGMIPAIVGALFGSSWQLVSGPTVAGSLVMFSALSAMAEPASAQYVVLGLTLAFLVGVLELSMGVLQARRARQLHIALGHRGLHRGRRRAHRGQPAQELPQAGPDAARPQVLRGPAVCGHAFGRCLLDDGGCRDRHRGDGDRREALCAAPALHDRRDCRRRAWRLTY